jgi:hypothetical protein
MLYPEPPSASVRGKKGGDTKAGKGKKSSSSETLQVESGKEKRPFSKVRLSIARAVLRHSVELARSVMDATISLDDALVAGRQGAVSAH